VGPAEAGAGLRLALNLPGYLPFGLLGAEDVRTGLVSTTVVLGRRCASRTGIIWPVRASRPI